jgi:hypothetical protein
MAPPLETRRKYFTVEEANRTLPLVRMIVSDIVEQFRAVEELGGRLSALQAKTSVMRKPHEKKATGEAASDSYAEERAQSQLELEALEAKLRDYIEELEKLGVELKGPNGLCDFPSLKDGREIYLCWTLGEPEVAYWHELHTGVAGRQPIKGPQAAASAAPTRSGPRAKPPTS